MVIDDSRVSLERACAIHEAGHAVVAIALGVDVVRVTLHPPCCYVTGPSLDQDVIPCLIQCLAGEQAEVILCGGITEPYNESDRRKARALLKWYEERTGRDYPIAIHRAYARRLVHEYAREIERVAKALIKAGELCGADVLDLLQGRSPDLWRDV